MKFRKILSVVLAGVVAVTAAVSGLSVSAAAVKTSISVTGEYIDGDATSGKGGWGFDILVFSKEWRDRIKFPLNDQETGVDFDKSDVITVKAVDPNTNKEIDAKVIASFSGNGTGAYVISESGCTIGELIEKYNSKTDVFISEWWLEYHDLSNWEKVSLNDLNLISIKPSVEKKGILCTITVSPGDDNKITVPTTVKAAAKSATSVAVTWKSTNADSYNIYRSTSKTGTYKKIGTSKTTSYTDKGLTKGKTYYYKVTAVSGGTESDFSTVVSAKAVAPAPSTVKAVKAKSGAATITWSKSSGASGYQIYMSTSSTSGFKLVKTSGASSAASFTKTGLTSGQTYYFKIRTYTGVNGKRVYSGFSKVVKVTV